MPIRFSKFWNSSRMIKVRMRVARCRARIDPYYQIRELSARFDAFVGNAPYEFTPERTWQPCIMGIEETLQNVIAKKLSLARYGDGEFELMKGKEMSFELANSEMADRLKDILRHPLPNCLNCVPNIFGSLSRYRSSDVAYWRAAAVWMRPILRECITGSINGGGAQNSILGDPQVSRAYLGVGDPQIAPKVFKLWKELFNKKDILIVEGRYSRLGIGNDLFAGANSLRRIWCPATGAYSQYSIIKNAVLRNATKGENCLIVIALGATATILAYDLAKLGFWAIDAGHVDVEYMWMKMGAKSKVALDGRYVNEAIDGHVRVWERDEISKYNVIDVIN